MVDVRVLVICTGNTCRSPMAAALLADRLGEVAVDATVRSAGTLGWSDRPATDKALAVAAEYGLDLSGHRSSRLPSGPLEVDLALAMTRDHAGAAVARDPSAAHFVFLPSEFARLAADMGDRAERESVAEYVVRVGSSRPAGPIGRAREEIPDPAGEPLEVYRRVAERLERELTTLARALSGPRIRR